MCVLFGLIRIDLLSILVGDLTVHPLTLPYLGERLVIDPQVVFVIVLDDGCLMALPDHEGELEPLPTDRVLVPMGKSDEYDSSLTSCHRI